MAWDTLAADRPSARELVGVYLRGVCMGIADAVPGVSGGTIALITGIYDRLVAAITAFDPRVAVTSLRSRGGDDWRAVREMVAAMDVPFLLALGTGVITAVVTAAHVVEFALDAYTAVTFAFFFGLIAASAVVLADETSVGSPRGAAVALAGFLVAVVVTGLPEGTLAHTPVVVFASGAIAVCAMVLPGVSGSLILLVLGQYHFMLNSLQTFVGGVTDVVDGGGLAGVTDAAVPVVTFVAGAVVGLLTVSHAIRWALERYRRLTLTFLVSLMVGALRRPTAEVAAAVDAWTPATTLAVVGAAVVGGGIVIGFDRVAEVDY